MLPTALSTDTCVETSRGWAGCMRCSCTAFFGNQGFTCSRSECGHTWEAHRQRPWESRP